MGNHTSLFRQYVSFTIIAVAVFSLGTFVYTRFIQSDGGHPTTDAAEPVSATEDIHTAAPNQSSDRAMLINKIAQLDAQQKALNEDIARLQNQSRQDETADIKEPLTPEEEDARNVAFYESHIRYIQEQMNTESVDVAWAESADEQIHQKYIDTKLMSSVKAECRATVCQLDFEMSADNPSSPGIESINQNPPWNGPFMIKLNEDGKTGMMLIAREGYELPRADQDNAAM